MVVLLSFFIDIATGEMISTIDIRLAVAIILTVQSVLE
jgi:hypothetical protein